MALSTKNKSLPPAPAISPGSADQRTEVESLNAPHSDRKRDRDSVSSTTSSNPTPSLIDRRGRTLPDLPMTQTTQSLTPDSNSNSNLSPEQRRRAKLNRLAGIVDLTTRDVNGDTSTVTSDITPSFEMLVIGCGGGPLETNLSSYLLKPYSRQWQDGCAAVEAGSALGALARLLETHPYSFTGFNLNIGVDLQDQTVDDEPESGSPADSTPAPCPISRKIGPASPNFSAGRLANQVWSMIHSFAISHAHLDHIQGLIMSSGAGFTGPRPLYGTHRTLSNIERIMDGGVWPKLAGYESDGKTAGRAYLFRSVTAPTTKYLPLSPDLSFIALPVSHGMDPSHFHDKPKAAPKDPNDAFFIREESSGLGREMLFFGDVEPDSISKRPLNEAVWRAAAPKIIDGTLSTVFIECSYPTAQPVAQLWGHLSPPFVLEELVVLARLIREERTRRTQSSDLANAAQADTPPLQGVTVVIIHVKDDVLPLPPSSPNPASTAVPVKTKASVSASADEKTSMSNATASVAGPDSAPPHGPPSGARQRPSFPPASPSTPDSPSQQAPLILSPPVPSHPHRRASTAFLGPGSSTSWAWAQRKSLDVAGLGRWELGSGLYHPALGPLSPRSLTTVQQASSGGARRASVPSTTLPPTGTSSNGKSSPNGHSSSSTSYLSVRQGKQANASGLRGLVGAGKSVSAGASPTRAFHEPNGVMPLSSSSHHDSPALLPSLLQDKPVPPAPNEEPSEFGLGGQVPRSAQLDSDDEGDGDGDQEQHDEPDQDQVLLVDETVYERIERELNELERDKFHLGVRFLIAEQGMRIVF